MPAGVRGQVSGARRTTPLHRVQSTAKEANRCMSGSAASGMQNVSRNTLKRRALRGAEDTRVIPLRRYNKSRTERVILYERYSINKAY